MDGILSVCVAWCVIVSLLERACLPLSLSLFLCLLLLLFWQLTVGNGRRAVREICSCLLYRGSPFQSAAVSLGPGGY